VSLESAAGAFDGVPNDPEAARRGPPPAAAREAGAAPAGEEQPAPQKGRRGRAARGPKAQAAPPPPPLTEAQRAEAREVKLIEARGLLKGVVGLVRKQASRKYRDRVPADVVRGLLEPLELTEDELAALAEPTADGMTELGLDLPWWVRLVVVFMALEVKERWDGVTQSLEQAAAAASPEAPAAGRTVEAGPPGTRWDAEARAWVRA
jgi:hypothetical protein